MSLKEIEKKIELKEVETEHLKVKGKVEQAIINAYSIFGIKITLSLVMAIGAVILMYRITLFFLQGA